MMSSLQPAVDFMKRSKKADKPFFVWLNPSRMHMFTHLRPEHRYLAAKATSEDDLYGSGMVNTICKSVNYWMI